MFKKIKAGIKERIEERKAITEIEDIKQEQELEELAKPIVDKYGVSLDTAKKYVLAQQRKKAITEAKEKRNKTLTGLVMKIGDGIAKAEEAREKYEQETNKKKPSSGSNKRRKEEMVFEPPGYF